MALITFHIHNHLSASPIPQALHTNLAKINCPPALCVGLAVRVLCCSISLRRFSLVYPLLLSTVPHRDACRLLRVSVGSKQRRAGAAGCRSASSQNAGFNNTLRDQYSSCRPGIICFKRCKTQLDNMGWATPNFWPAPPIASNTFSITKMGCLLSIQLPNQLEVWHRRAATTPAPAW